MELILTFSALLAMSNTLRAMLTDVARKKENLVRSLVADNPELARILFDATPDNIPSLTDKIGELPDEFFRFMTEYCINAVVEDTKDGRVDADTLVVQEKFADCLTENAYQFCVAFLDSEECRKEINKAYNTRIAGLKDDPWFFLAVPVMLKLLGANELN